RPPAIGDRERAGSVSDIAGGFPFPSERMKPLRGVSGCLFGFWVELERPGSVMRDQVLLGADRQAVSLRDMTLVRFHQPVFGSFKESPKALEVRIPDRHLFRFDHIPGGVGVVVSGIPPRKTNLPAAPSHLFGRL